MTTAELSVTIHDASGSSQTVNYNPDVFATNSFGDDKQSTLWNSIVDKPLVEWGLQPSNEDEDGLISPSGEAIARAAQLVRFMRGSNWPVPTSVLADGEGGIVFERKCDPDYQTVEISDSGQMVLYTYKDCKLIWHEPLDFSSE